MERLAGAAGDRERETILGPEGKPALGAVHHRRNVEGTVLHQVVRDHLASFLVQAADRGGLPRFVERDFSRYLGCGVLAHGFARLACAACRSEVLVPFSCKSRGARPSCNARRAHDTAIHLVEQVLPRAAYRQWTLSLPIPVRFCLARDARLLSEVLGLFVRALFAFQRRTARRLGVGQAYLAVGGPANASVVSPDLRPLALRAAARTGDDRVHQAMVNALTGTVDRAVRKDLVEGLASFVDPALANRRRELLLAPGMTAHERFELLETQSKTLEQSQACWSWVVENQAPLARMLPENPLPPPRVPEGRQAGRCERAADRLLLLHPRRG